MKTVEELYDRFKNLLEVQRFIQEETIRSDFNEDDLKSLIYWLGLLKHLKGAATDGEGTK